MKPQLAFILDRWTSATTFSDKSAWREQARVYIANQDLSVLEPEIMSINSLREINKLLGAGCVGVVWDMVNAKRLVLLGSGSPYPASFQSFPQ